MIKNSNNAMNDSQDLAYANMVILSKFVSLFVKTDCLDINLLPKTILIMIRVAADCLLVYVAY